MYRLFLSVNTGNAIKIFHTGDEGDAGGAEKHINNFFVLNIQILKVS